MDSDSEERKVALQGDGFTVQNFHVGNDWLFEIVTPEGVKIGPMNEIEAGWMHRGWKAAKYGK